MGLELLWYASVSAPDRYSARTLRTPEVKLAIVREYASAYSKIMEAWRRDTIHRLSWIYIDGYAGPGYHVSKATGEVVEARSCQRPCAESTNLR